MKRSRILLLATVCASATLFAAAGHPATPATGSERKISGTWQGTLLFDAQVIHIVFRIQTKQPGQPRATLNVIEQGPTAIPVSGVTQERDEVEFAVAAIHGSYKGKLSRDGATLDGNWTVDRTVPLVLHRAMKNTVWTLDPSPHTVHFVTVNRDVNLEVLDWGGTGQPLVLLTGLGDNAHVYDQFAPKLAASYRVVGITRRGFGASSVPSEGYSADRLGDDVLEVAAALNLSLPIIVGHSIAGEELSYIGLRHPEKVAGLIYLDAGYSYAFYNPARPDLVIDENEVRSKLEALMDNHTEVMDELANTDLPRLTKELQEAAKSRQSPGPAEGPIFNGAPAPPPVTAMVFGERRFSAIKSVPILAIFADPHASHLGAMANANPVARAALEGLEAQDLERTETQVAAFEQAMPAARVVRLAHADHAVFRSNEAEVVREINAFVATLPSVQASK